MVAPCGPGKSRFTRRHREALDLRDQERHLVQPGPAIGRSDCAGSMTKKDDRRRYVRCSFCGKGQDQVRKLIAGPGVFICDQCIALCQEALDYDGNTATVERPPSTAPPHTDALAITGRQLQAAIWFAHGMSVKAIGYCIGLSSNTVAFHIQRAYEAMSATRGLPLNSTRRREIHKWLNDHGLLLDKSESEAVLVRAIAAIDGVPNLLPQPVSGWPRLIRWARSTIGRPDDSSRLERGRAQQKAMLEDALWAVRKPFNPES